MSNSQRVLSRASGRIDAPIMFIGEAPGRLGADASAIPFHGDKAGENFEALLDQVGLSREDCFITNAVLCNPRDEKGNNATPARSEVANCAKFLKAQVDLLQPKLVVTLGAQALSALRLVQAHEVELSSGVRKMWPWYGRKLIPLYHPGQRAMIHRSFFNQLADYTFVAENYRRLILQVPRRTGAASPTYPAVAAIVRSLLRACGPLTYFALHKLFYLLEYEHYRTCQARLTRCFIVRQKDGPYVTDLNIKKIKKAIPDLRLWTLGDQLILGLDDEPGLFPEEETWTSSATPDAKATFNRVVERYAKKSDEDLKRIVYLTAPMRNILRREKYHRENMFNAPVAFSPIKP